MSRGNSWRWRKVKSPYSKKRHVTVRAVSGAADCGRVRAVVDLRPVVSESDPACLPPTPPTRPPSGSPRRPRHLRRQRPLVSRTPEPCSPPTHLRPHPGRCPRPAALVAAAALDVTQPVAVLLLAVLPAIPDTGNPAAIIADIAAALAPGRITAISHLTARLRLRPRHHRRQRLQRPRPTAPLFRRTSGQVAIVRGTLSAEWPGIVPVTRCGPHSRKRPGAATDLTGAVARLPADADPGNRSAAATTHHRCNRPEEAHEKRRSRPGR